MEIVPGSLPWRDAYKLLIGAIVPRPIAFVSTVSPDGINNVAPFSFFNGVCPQPFVVSFAPMRKGSDGEKKDTVANIEATKEFVVNIVSEQIVRQMNETSAEFPAEVDEFAASGLTPAPSLQVKAPRVLESPVNMECKLLQIIEFGDTPGAGCLVLGEVVQMHVRDDVYQDGKLDPDRLQAVARMAGNLYSTTRDRFELIRPR